MPVKIGSKPASFKYNKTYDIQLIIKDLDYSEDLMKVIITSSLATAYPAFEIVILVDQNDIILEKLYGDDPIKLTITLKAYDGDFGIPGQTYNFDLMMIKGDFSLTERPVMAKEEMQKERTFYKLVCLPRTAFKVMTTIVNDVFVNTTIGGIISQLSSKVGTRIFYDIYGENTTQIDQVVIPPTTLYNVIKEHQPGSSNSYDGFLDSKFGLFSGVPGVFCDYTGVVRIKNLTSKMQKGQSFTVYHLPTSGIQNFTEILNSCNDGKHFYTYDKLSTENAWPSKFGNLASTINSIVKPKDKLYSILTHNLEKIGQDSSISYFPNVKIGLPHNGSLERTRYITDETGNELDETSFISKHARAMSDLASVSFRIEKNFDIFGFMDVGECVKLNTQTIETKDFEGKYILWSSSIDFSRMAEWASVAMINLIRTNKYI